MVEELLLEQYEGSLIESIKDFIVGEVKLFTKGNNFILGYAEDSDRLFVLHDEFGEEQWFSYEVFEEYFKLNK